MQPDIISNNSRSVKYAFEILYDDENQRHNDGVRPIAPLKCGDQDGWHPANDDADVRNHRENDNERTNHWRKIQAENSQRRSYEDAIHQAHQKLAAKVRGDVAIDFRQHIRDFISQGRRTQRQVFFPVLFDARLFV